MSALGTSITGGEPQEAMAKTCRYLELLKDEFGEDHHTHLYTGITGGRENMRRLSEAGLDEIRFHPPLEMWGDMHGTEWEDILHIAREGGAHARLRDSRYPRGAGVPRVPRRGRSRVLQY